MKSAAVLGLLAGSLLLPSFAHAFTCEQAIWALQNFTPAELEKMAAPFGGITHADRVKALRCVSEANKGAHLRIKVRALHPTS